ncbi:MAG: HAMP domain-containing protein [Clostridiaceae bacterium]|nr:HAMP domain-containing protein [Clostridiaceae bacterium]
MDSGHIEVKAGTPIGGKKKGIKINLTLKITTLITISIAVVVTVSSYVFFRLSNEALKEETRNGIILLVSNAAVAIDAEKLKKIDSPEDEGSETYLELQELLQKIKQAGKIREEDREKIRHIYTIAKKDDKYIYVVDSVPGSDNKEHSCVGDEFPIKDYPEAADGFKFATAGKKALKYDESGAVQSGFAPIKDNAGNVVGMLVIDMDVSDIKKKEAELLIAEGLVLITALLIALALGIFFSRYLTSPIIKLIQGTRKVSEGDFDTCIELQRNDEIGELAKTINTMTFDLKTSQEALKKHNLELEEKVAQRTSELSHINKEIRDILDNMSQAIFTIDHELKFNAQHSRHAIDIFGDMIFAERKIIDVFFPRMDQHSDREKMYIWLSKVFNNKDTCWEDLEALQPIKEFEIDVQKADRYIRKHLGVKFRPIIDVRAKNYKGKIVKLMVIIQDITDSKALQLEIEKKEKEYKDNINQIIEIIKMDQEMFRIFINECKEKLLDFEPMLIKLKSNSSDVDTIDELLRIMHTIKGNAKAFKLERISAEAHSIESIISSIKKGECIMGEELLSEIFVRLDHFNGLFSETLDLYDRIVHGKSLDMGKTRSEERNNADREIIKVNICKINRLSELIKVADHIIDEGITISDSPDMLRGKVEEISSIIKETEKHIQSIKKIDMRRLFARFPRMVRDVSLELGKKVRLFTEGEDIQVDKNIFDNISDPIIHIVRNALDHGIEMPIDRIRQGKPEEGRIEIYVSMLARELLVEISDDGKGLDVDRIKAKAVAKGIIAPEKALYLSDDEAVNLIFSPGFSTNDKITIISGRGMGMDVVKSSIEQNLNGTVKLESRKNHGLKLIMKIPVT